MKFELKQAFFIFYTAFTAATIVSVAVACALGSVDLRVVGYFASIALMCLFPFLQLLWFTPAVLHTTGYAARVAGFGLSYLPILIIAALVGGWFAPSPGSWIIFIGIYLVILACMTLGFHLYYKRTCGTYQAALERYREQEGNSRAPKSPHTPA